MDAYVKAFDKHFNMLLSDIDEQYIVNQVLRANRAMLLPIDRATITFLLSYLASHFSIRRRTW
jgi:small nuclear ribonucleoprotein (snRNP)-like protein